MFSGTRLTLYTARAAVLLFAGAIALFLAGAKHDPRPRLVWTLGCALLWVHVCLAFALVHHWSHARAIQFTATQTKRLTGIDAGFGIYFNYLFMLVWAMDCGVWWIGGLQAYRTRSRAVTITVYAFLCFITFNAAVVFANAASRYVGLLVAGCLIIFWLARRRQPNARTSVAP